MKPINKTTITILQNNNILTTIDNLEHEHIHKVFAFVRDLNKQFAGKGDFVYRVYTENLYNRREFEIHTNDIIPTLENKNKQVDYLNSGLFKK